MNTSSPLTWLTPAALEPLHRVNEQCLTLMTDLARQSDPPPESFALVDTLRANLVRLNAEARRRAAEHPFLLLDFEFRHPSWWQRLRGRADLEPARSSPGAPAPRPRIVALARAALTLAWHVAKSEREAALLLLGADPAVATLLPSFSLTDLGRLAERHAHTLRPRWAERPMVWHRLLHAAHSGKRHALRDVRLHGLQLLGGDLRGRAG